MTTQSRTALSGAPRVWSAARLWLEERLTARAAVWILALALVSYVAFYSFASFYRFATFRQGFDLAQNEQTIWNTAHGRWFETSPFVALRYDFDDGPVPFELLLAVPYAVFPGTFTLLFLQTLALASGAVPLFLLARARLGPWLALGIAIAYWFHVTVTRINMYEFQFRSFVLAFFLFAFYFYVTRRFGWFLVCAALMLSCKSEVAFTLPVFGLYALWERRSLRWVITPILMGLVWVLFVFGYVIPTFAPADFIRSVYGYGWLGNNFGEMFVTIFTRPLYVAQNVLTPDKLAYVAQTLLLLLFLPLLRVRFLIFALPNLAFNLLAVRSVQYSVLYFYQPFVVGACFLASIYAIAETFPRLARRRTLLLQSAAVLSLVGASLFFNATTNNLALRALRHPEPPERVAAAQRILDRIPPDAAVAASSFLGPHLAQRRQLYFFPGTKSYPFPPGLAEYVVVDLQLDTGAQARRAMTELENSNWTVVTRDTDYLLYQKRP